MAERVSMEEVGSAEDVLRRLVHERRLLEGAAQVLEVYRKVMAELSSVEVRLEKLQIVEGRLKEEITGLEEVKVAELHKIAQEGESLRERERESTRLEVDRLRIEVSAVEREYNSQLARSVTMEKQYEEDLKEYEEDIRVAKEELEEVRNEHRVLVEAIGRVTRAVSS